MGEAYQRHLGRHHRPVGLADLADGFEQHLPGPRQHADRQALGEIGAAHPLGLGQAVVLGRLRHELETGDEVAELGEVGEHHRRVGPGIVLCPKLAQRPGDVALHRELEQVDDARPVGKAEHAADLVQRDSAAGMGDRLVENRERVAHRALGGARHGGERFLLGLDPLRPADLVEMPDQQRRVDAAQVEALAARQHRHRNFSDLGGGEDEFCVRRRLLQRLQEGVEGALPRACGPRR